MGKAGKAATRLCRRRPLLLVLLLLVSLAGVLLTGIPSLRPSAFAAVSSEDAVGGSHKATKSAARGDGVHDGALAPPLRAAHQAAHGEAGTDTADASAVLPCVCLLGNAPTVAAAQRVHAQWHGRLPSFWYIWDETSATATATTKSSAQAPAPDSNQLNASRNISSSIDATGDAVLVVAGRVEEGVQAQPFAEGLQLALEAARSPRPGQSRSCDYFFTHDDDLVFAVDADSLDGLQLRSDTNGSGAPTRHDAVSARNAAAAQGGSDKGAVPPPLPHAVLLAALTQGRPAVASFPWAVGRARFPAMAALAAAYAGRALAPLTGFDNGMVLYHASVVDFFMPFAPRGEGGLEGHWTLGAHFLQLFAPLLFRGHALVLQALVYNNTVNLDNLSTEQRRAGRSQQGDLVFHRGVRHPYEYRLNAAYERFLRSGLKCPACPVGRALGTADVTWSVGDGLAAPVDPRALVSALNSFYDLRHPAVRDALARVLRNPLQVHPAPNKAGSSDTPSPTPRPDVPLPLPLAAAAVVANEVALGTRLRFAVHVFAFRRLDAFQRLWASLAAVVPPSRAVAVDITIHHDLDAENPAAAATHRAYLAGLRSHLGPVRIHAAPRHRGLRESVLAAELPRHADEYVLLLEDDIVVAPLALRFAEAALRRCLYGPVPAPHLVGISLYAQLYSEGSETWLPGVETPGAQSADVSGAGRASGSVGRPAWPTADLVAWAMPQSWGALYRGTVWRAFVTWTLAQPTGERFLVPDTLTNRWPESVSWKKALVRFMAERSLALVYPRLPRRLSFSTNTLAVGINDRVRPNDPRRRVMEDRFLLDLVSPANSKVLGLRDDSDDIRTRSGGTSHDEYDYDYDDDDGNKVEDHGLAAAAPCAGARCHRAHPQAVVDTFAALLPPVGQPLPHYSMLGGRSSAAAVEAAAKTAEAALVSDATLPSDGAAASAKASGSASAAGPASPMAAFDLLTVALGPGQEHVAASVCTFPFVSHVVVVQLAGHGAAFQPPVSACRGTGVTVVDTVSPPAATTPWYLHAAVLDATRAAGWAPVLLVADGWTPAAAEAEYLLRTWQGHFFRHLVGAAPLGRGVAAKGTTSAGPAFFLPALLLLHRNVLTTAAVRLAAASDAPAWCGPVALAAAAREGGAGCPVAVDFGTSHGAGTNAPVPADAERSAGEWAQCAAALGVRLSAAASSTALKPTQRYGSSTPYAGISWLKCQAG